MALSPEAARLLAARTGRAKPPSPTPNAATTSHAKPVDPEHAAFRERARREDERFQRATDSEYWLALCFRDDHTRSRFLAALNVPTDTRYIAGPIFAQAITTRPKPSPTERIRQMLAARSTRGEHHDAATRLAVKPPPDPIVDAAATGDMAVDALADFAALLAALKNPQGRNPVNLLDSRHWACVYFAARPEKDTFLADSGLDVLGDKYLDGHEAVRILNLTI